MQLFVDVARYTSKHMSAHVSSENTTSKKRKLDEEGNHAKQPPSVTTAATTTLVLSGASTNVYTAPDTSFAVPQRKKMKIDLVVDVSKPGNGIIGVTHDASGINYAIPFADIGTFSRFL